MKNKISIIALAIAGSITLNNCNRFEEINTSQTAADINKVQPEYFLNASILGAQMNPEVAERAFVLYWQGGGHQVSGLVTGLQNGYVDDGWTTNYWNSVANWLSSANLAINVGKGKQQNGSFSATTNNVIQVARIWRAYLMSEMSDNFGSIPTDAFQGENPEFKSQKDVYYFILAELKDAVANIDASVSASEIGKQDPAYGYDWNKWIKYANSMRMRLAMRISEADPAKAKAEFEDAVSSGQYISALSENFKVEENNVKSWDELTAVMSRTWNSQLISSTLSNLYVGLGGITSASQVGADLQSSIKNADYIGIKLTEQFPTATNAPMAGYWLDGLPHSIDPRAYQTFYIPGDTSNPVFPDIHKARSTKGTLKFADGTTKEIDAKYTWNALIGGEWGDKIAKNGLVSIGKVPAIASQYRGPEGKTTHRIFFGSWETYFLIAEAGLRGWNVPMNDEAAYNKGIQESFSYNGVSQHYSAYINSTDYNRVGTSVKYSHETEPSASRSVTYTDIATGATASTTISYPSNTIYKGGVVKNDKLTKIITQKFLANTPWLPLETWNDHRRLGLPFFENQAVEKPIPTMPALNSGNYTTNQISFFPQRLKYPSSFRNNDATNYNKAVSLLGGEDDVFTPLWWAKKN